MEDIWVIIFSVGIVQGLFLIVAIWFTKNRKQFSKELFVLILLSSVTLLSSELVEISGKRTLIIRMYRIGETLPLLIGPLFYFYTIAAISPDVGFRKQNLIHFLPFFVFTFLFMPFYLESYDYKVEYINKVNTEGLTLGMKLFGWFKGMYAIGYLIYSWILARRYRVKKLRKNFHVNLIYWLVILQFSAVLLTQLLVTSELLQISIGISSDRAGALFFTFIYYVFALILIISPKGILPEDVQLAKSKRYKKSSLSHDQKEDILIRLTQSLMKDKPYLRADLNLDDLAKSIRVNPNFLSQVINERLDKNFYTLINEYRIEEFKRNINGSKKTIYGVALDSGFNSKSAFNRVFKEITGTTPSQYKKSID
ncbi:MAG: helix-turn-helix domain-containing protein [Bacteroidota bacterium]